MLTTHQLVNSVPLNPYLIFKCIMLIIAIFVYLFMVSVYFKEYTSCKMLRSKNELRKRRYIGIKFIAALIWPFTFPCYCIYTAFRNAHCSKHEPFSMLNVITVNTNIERDSLTDMYEGMIVWVIQSDIVYRWNATEKCWVIDEEITGTPIKNL